MEEDSDLLKIEYDVPNNLTLSLRSVSSLSTGSQQGFVYYHCKRYCVNEKFKCRSHSIKCNFKCHTSSSCKNK